MSKSKKFVFDDYNTELEKGNISFHFTVELEDKGLNFTEQLSFPPVWEKIPQELLKKILDNLHLILGISYWKLYCPQIIDTGSIKLSKEQAKFWDTVYTKGLGEFYFKNKIDFRNLVSFPFDKNKFSTPIPFIRKNRHLVPIGGGKDSIVTAEILKKKDEKFDILTIGESQIQKDISLVLEKKPIVIRRKIDPKVFELNKRGEAYNGHVPVSAIIAFLSVMAAIFYDYKEVLVSNEKSANYGNVEYLGEEINHQWSKSEEFEQMFNDYVSDNITPDVRYYSFLRDYNELEIARMFSKYTQYFNYFSSCNTNFKITGTKSTKKWCGKCPKCLFVFTMLSAYITKQEILAIFEKNLFEDETLLSYFKELLGIGEIKPFECVGTPEEMKEALNLASKKGEFKDSFLMKFYEENK